MFRALSSLAQLTGVLSRDVVLSGGFGLMHPGRYVGFCERLKKYRDGFDIELPRRYCRINFGIFNP